MPGKNKTPLVGWHPPADLLAQLRAEEQRRGSGKGVRSAILTQALREFLEHNENSSEGERHDVAHISDR